MHKKGIITGSFVGVLALFGLVLNGSGAFATQTCTTDEQTGQVTCANSATASVTVAAACSFSRTSGSGEYAGILANNASVEVTGSTFSTTCNDSGGYAIYAIGYSNNTFGNTDLIFDNDPDNANKITTSSNPGSNTSYWQMELVAGVGNHPVLENGYGSYSAVPSTYTKVASYASADMGTAQTVTATYKAAASATQPAGTYTGAVKYTMVHPNTNIPNQPYDCASGNICYFPNAGNTTADTMGDQSITSSDTSATLWASNFQRPGYGFVGWSDAYDYVANEGSESNSDAHIYGPNDDVTFAAGQYSGANGGLSLYAVWVEPAKDSNGNELTFQTNNLLTATLADGTTLGNKNNGFVTALRDKRDNQVYAVAKLADGNYWMIENLRLNNNSTESNWGDNSLSQGFGGVFNGLADAESENFSDSTTANSLYNTGNAYTMPRYNNNNTNSPVANMTGADGDIYSYGNYYTWAAAIADTTAHSSSSDIINTSICPAGWHLPTGTGSGEFGLLSNSLGGYKDTNDVAQNMNSSTTPTGAEMSATLRSYPNNFVYSGNFNYSSARTRGSYGLYWSSTAGSSDSAYRLTFSSSSVSPGTGYSIKSVGYSVRCVLGS